MQDKTVKSKQKPEARGWFVLHDDETPQYAEFVVPMDGRLDGFTCFLRLELIDGRVHVGGIQYRPSTPMPLNTATNRALMDLRLGNMPYEAEQCLRIIADRGHGLDWLEAFEASRRRSGRAGTAPQLVARIAERRMEAEAKAPRNAIRYMVRMWPDDFVSRSATHAKVNRAISRGMLARTPEGLSLTDEARRLLNMEETK